MLEGQPITRNAMRNNEVPMTAINANMTQVPRINDARNRSAEGWEGISDGSTNAENGEDHHIQDRGLTQPHVNQSTTGSI